MRFFDRVRAMLGQAKTDAEAKAATTAAKAAANQALDRLEHATDGALSDAEGALERARKAREGRADARPSSRTADEIVAEIEALAKEAEKSRGY
jgi:hypothetical protein